MYSEPMQVTVNGGIGIGQVADVLYYAAALIIGQEGIFLYVIGELVLDGGEQAVSGTYLLSWLGAGQPYFVYFTRPFILVKSHFLQLCGVELEQDIGVILLNVTLTQLSASGKLIVL